MTGPMAAPSLNQYTAKAAARLQDPAQSGNDHASADVGVLNNDSNRTIPVVQTFQPSYGYGMRGVLQSAETWWLNT